MTHGTQAAYRNGCHCTVCREAHCEYVRRVSRERRDGIGRVMDQSEAIAHVEFLRESGMSDHAIEGAAGLSLGCLGHMTTRGGHVCRRSTADRILSVTPGEPSPRHRSNADGPHQLIRSMEAAGMSDLRISAMAGMSKSWTRKVLNQRRVNHNTRRRIAVLYELLARQGIVPASVLDEVGV